MIAVESKWSGSSWATSIGRARVVSAVEQVRRGARQLRLLSELRRCGIEYVGSVVVLWGPDADFVAIAGSGSDATAAGGRRHPWVAESSAAAYSPRSRFKARGLSWTLMPQGRRMVGRSHRLSAVAVLGASCSGRDGQLGAHRAVGGCSLPGLLGSPRMVDVRTTPPVARAGAVFDRLAGSGLRTLAWGWTFGVAASLPLCVIAILYAGCCSLIPASRTCRSALTKSTDTPTRLRSCPEPAGAGGGRSRCGVGHRDDRLIVGVVVCGHQSLEQRVREVLPRLVGGSGPLRLQRPCEGRHTTLHGKPLTSTAMVRSPRRARMSMPCSLVAVSATRRIDHPSAARNATTCACTAASPRCADEDGDAASTWRWLSWPSESAARSATGLSRPAVISRERDPLAIEAHAVQRHPPSFTSERVFDSCRSATVRDPADGQTTRATPAEAWRSIQADARCRHRCRPRCRPSARRCLAAGGEGARASGPSFTDVSASVLEVLVPEQVLDLGQRCAPLQSRCSPPRRRLLVAMGPSTPAFSSEVDQGQPRSLPRLAACTCRRRSLPNSGPLVMPRARSSARCVPRAHRCQRSSSHRFRTLEA